MKFSFDFIQLLNIIKYMKQSKKSIAVFRIFILLFICSLFFSCASASKNAYPVKKIEQIENPFQFSINYSLPDFNALILGDIHGYNIKALVNDEKSWKKYLEKTKKPFDSSFSNTQKILKDTLKSDTEIVIIPGDLTVNGEKQSHLLLAEILSDFEKSGKKVFIVPGNHDVKNPTGKQFLKKKGKYTEAVSDAEFSIIYKDFGYSEAVSRDSESLSYAVEPIPGLLLVCIDSNAWQKNIYFPVRAASTDGRIKTKTLRWLKSVFSKGNSERKTIIAVQHHPFSEEVFEKPKTLAKSDKIRKIYREYGVSLVIAGHRHKYYINSTETVPQIIAPNVSSTAANCLLLKKEKNRITVTKNPFNYSE